MKKSIVSLLSLVLCLSLLFVCGCADTANTGAETTVPGDTTVAGDTTASEADSTGTDNAADGVAVRVAALKGPTGMGMVDLMSRAEQGETGPDYTFTIAASPDDLTATILNKSVDIAALPTNLAAVLYQKTEGEIACAAVNTLGVLYLLEKGDTVHSVADLKGKTIYATGKASTPEYILRYILQKNGIDPDTDVTIEYYGEHSELATQMVSGSVVLGMLPEPNVTSVLTSDSTARIALDLTAEWEKVEAGTTVMQGCIVVNCAFAEAHPEAVAAFLADYRASVETVNADPTAASLLVEKYGILPKAALAARAIPNCNITYIDGEEMRTGLDAFLKVLYEAAPASVGGKLPDRAFYYPAA